MDTTNVTKLHRILMERGLTQTDLYYLIQDTGKTIGKDRISRIVNGKHKNYHIDTARTIASALGLSIDDIVD